MVKRNRDPLPRVGQKKKWIEIIREDLSSRGVGETIFVSGVCTHKSVASYCPTLDDQTTRSKR